MLPAVTATTHRPSPAESYPTYSVSVSSASNLVQADDLPGTSQGQNSTSTTLQSTAGNIAARPHKSQSRPIQDARHEATISFPSGTETFPTSHGWFQRSRSRSNQADPAYLDAYRPGYDSQRATHLSGRETMPANTPAHPPHSQHQQDHLPSPQQTRQPTSNKRQRANEARVSYPRKRAVTACHFCRTRKTKCDNQRPSCGTCNSLDVNCIYSDRDTDFSTFDHASLAILDRINHAIELIENHSQPILGMHQAAPSPKTSLPSGMVAQAPGARDSTQSHAAIQSLPSVSDMQSPVDMFDTNATTLMEALDVAANCSSSPILEWPIFEGSVNSDEIIALFFQPDSLQVSEPSRSFAASPTKSTLVRRSSSLGRGIREDEIPILIQDFLHHVHIKNPILDTAVLIDMGREVAEEGYTWDGRSCLVLIACALANLSSPFTAIPPSEHDNSQADARDYATAEQYYTAARKRVGLLDNSVLATQCSFLIGIYEMYSLRPLKAWLSFNRACTIFQTYLHSRSLQVVSRSSRRLEQRLYWSCLKSECEMRDEVDLPPTGLAKVDYPDVFPSPPGSTPEPEESSQATSTGALEPVFQRSWYYYLSEIASRRIAIRIAQALHSTPPAIWLTMPLKRLQRIAEELESQLLRWLEHIPELFAVKDYTFCDELTFLLQARYLDLRERIWRPFLYILTHTEPPASDIATVLTYAGRCVDLLCKYIRHTAIKHRHHGSWYVARQLFTKSLLLLAAVKSGRMAMPQDWISSIELAQNCLKYWEGEATDLRIARYALKKMFVAVHSANRLVSSED